ncbi:hypothetical protein NDU88_004100 [Pleurodeles waltl]|uniref:Uncharacterized protein n=1 Tax=Pleurodeles waltl TaxID=8319 RepID=A0AAV7RF41_PLEWA|nr:hypothetical protein NDU88_004100 [Pleurodeles waltl]
MALQPGEWISLLLKLAKAEYWDAIEGVARQHYLTLQLKHSDVEFVRLCFFYVDRWIKRAVIKYRPRKKQAA